MSNAGAIERYDDDARHIERLRRRATVWASMSGLKAEIAGQPDRVLGIGLTLETYGFRVNAFNVNAAFDWILGRLEPSAWLYVAVAKRHGWTIRPVRMTRDVAIARATSPGEEPLEVTWSIEDAIESHRLDTWVEDWRTAQQSGKRYAVTYVVRINGEPGTWFGDLRGALPDPLPEWVVKALGDPGRIKRYDAWWNYRLDMMWKSAAKRAAKWAIPDIMLGGSDDADHEFAPPAATARGRPPAGEAPDPDDDIADAEIVDDDQDLGGAADPHRGAETRHSAPAQADHRASEPTPPHVHDDAPESRGLTGRDDPGRPF